MWKRMVYILAIVDNILIYCGITLSVYLMVCSLLQKKSKKREKFLQFANFRKVKLSVRKQWREANAMFQ